MASQEEPRKQPRETAPQHKIELEGFSLNPDELQEIDRALQAEQARQESLTPEREPVRARIGRPIFRELVGRTIQELSRGDAIPTQEEVEADIIRLLHHRALNREEQRVIREIYTAAKEKQRALPTSPSSEEPSPASAPHEGETPQTQESQMSPAQASTYPEAVGDPQENVAHMRLARLKIENPDIDSSLLEDAAVWGEMGRQENLDRYLTTSWGQRLAPEQKTKVIDAYNIGAETEGHPPFVPQAADETARETQPPQPKQSATPEQQDAPAEDPQLEALLQTATGEQERKLMREAHRMGVEDIHYTRNNPEEASAFWQGEEVDAFITAHGQQGLERLHEAFYAGGRGRTHTGNPRAERPPPEPLEEPPEGSAPEPTTPITEPAAAQAEPASALQPESDEPANPELAELRRNLAEARTEYARLAVMAKKQNKKRPRDMDEGQAPMRINLLREDLTPIEGLADAETRYLDSVRAIRKLRGGQIRAELEREGRQFNFSNITDDKKNRKEIQKRIDALIEETVIREGVALYDEKTSLRLTSEHGFLHPDRAWKFVQRASEWYNNLDAYHRVELNKDLPWYAKENLKARGHNIPRNKILISAGLLGLGAGFAGLTAAGVIIGGAQTIQRGLGGAGAAVATDAGIQKLFQYRREKRTFKELKGVREDLANTYYELDDILDARNEELDDAIFNFEKDAASRRGKERIISQGTGAITGIAVGAGYAARAVRGGLSYASDLTGITPAWVAEKLGVSKDLIAKFIPDRGNAETAATQQAGAAPAAPAGATPKELSFWQKLGIVTRGSLGDEVSEPQKTPQSGAPLKRGPMPPYHESHPAPGAPMQGEQTSAEPWEERAAPTAPPPIEIRSSASPAPAETQPSPPAPVPPEPGRGSTPETKSAPAPTPEQKPPAPMSPEAKRMQELATVGNKEGAWQAVRRQFYERMRAHPNQYGMTSEDAKKLPELEKLGKGTKAAKILNRETLKTLKTAGYINQDGTTHVGMKPGARIILNPDNTINLEGDGKSIYEFDKAKARGGGVHPADEARRARGRAGAGRSHQDYVTGENKPRYATNQFLVDTTLEKPVTAGERAASPAGQAAAEQAQAATMKSNLQTFGMTQKELGNIGKIKTGNFMDSMERHAPEIAEYRGTRINVPIRITDGAFTTRGYTASLPEAAKYLDMNEQLGKYLKTLRLSERARLLKLPIGELMRTLSLIK